MAVNYPLNWKQCPLFVGTVTTRAGLKKLADKSTVADLVEIRVDALLASGVEPETILNALEKKQRPVLLTLRLPSEGGVYPWAKGERAALFTALLPDVEAIDIELAAVRELSSTLREARKQGLAIILSAHSIDHPVSKSTLHRWTRNLLQAAPTVAKIAVRVSHRQDLINLTSLIFAGHRQRWALMGLGSTAELSRLVLGSLGSALVYGYLDQPAAPGQPSIQTVRKLLEREC